MKMKIKDLIALLETIDQEAIINRMNVNLFDPKRNTLEVWILENYQEIDNTRKYTLSKYEINYSNGTIKLKYSQPTTELDVDLGSSSHDWQDRIAYTRNLIENNMKLGE